MKRLLWLIFAGLAVAAALLLIRSGGDEGSVASAAPAPAEPERDVRVKHEYVTVKLPPIATQPEGQSHVVALPGTRPASGPRRALRDPGLLERAGRAIVGDGTHRPEPFPRIRNF